MNHHKFVQETLDLVLPRELCTPEFANGSGYVQLTVGTHARFMLRYRELLTKTTSDSNRDTYLRMFDENPAGFIGRHLDDNGHPAYTLWNRAACIDKQFRMWGQPYFAINPDHAKNVCLATM